MPGTLNRAPPSSRPPRSGSSASRHAARGAKNESERRPTSMPVEPNPAHATTAPERSAVDRALARLGTEPRRTDLVPLLHALQADLGWLPKGALQQLADRMNLPFPDVWG